MNATDTTTWLDSLQPGDKVIIRDYGYGRHPDTIGTVSRRLPTQILIHGTLKDQRFQATTGREVGSTGGYSAKHLARYTPEQGQAIRLAHKQAVLVQVFQSLKASHLDHLSLDMCARLEQVLRDCGIWHT